MPQKPQTQQNSPDDILAQITAAVVAQFQEMQSSLDAKYDTLATALNANSSCLHNINTQMAKLEESPPSSELLSLLGPVKGFETSSSSSQLPRPPENLSIKSPKNTLSIFDGTNPLDWLFQANH
ncbi:hypothetical protein COLO4_06179 [Corchorus olitorius]|uniref:Uncharacterized protein n=1 Tax=Corchorus olitorius TaxID=93759 RepID=A0A1R3KNT3_9ROSI|nr:hypothetical protein COLO4_06179 [Corchorus olitorius]